jgi:hypothetical protein
MDLHSVLGDSLTFLYVHDIRTSQETHLLITKNCYGDSFTFVYVHGVRRSKEIYLWTTTVCYGGRFTFLYVRTSEETPL